MKSSTRRRSRQAEAFEGFDLGAADRPDAASQEQPAPLLSARDEHELAMRVKAGDESAREALTLANLRLVTAIAAKFRFPGVDPEDLIQEGRLGLIRATMDFDPDAHGTRFSTYASYWIRNAIMRATSDEGSLIHFPYHLAMLRKRYDRVRAEMIGERRSTVGGCWDEPTLEEVAERMGVSPRRLQFLDQARAGCLSYSTSARDVEEGGAVEVQLSDEHPPEGPLEIAERMEGLHRALDRLPRFEAWLIRRRYRLDDGGDGPASRCLWTRPASRQERETEARRIKRANRQEDEPRTFRDLERECGLAVYRLKQIERDALEKLRRSLARAAHPTAIPNAAGPPASQLLKRATA